MMDAHSIIHQLGGTYRAGRGQAPCPVCQPERRPDQVALSLSAQNGKILLYCFKGHCSFVDIANAINLPLGSVQIDFEVQRKADEKQAEYKAAQLAKARSLWEATQPVGNTKAKAYLRSRGITVSLPASLRFMPDIYHGPSASWCSAMIANVEPTGGVHRTYFTKQGKRLPNNAKMMLGPCYGGAVALSGGMGPLVVSEGIETSLSLLQMLDYKDPTVWATLSTSGMKGVELPSKPHSLIIGVDGDEAGKRAANSLASHATALDWNVSLMEAPESQDWNDVLMSGGAGMSDMDDKIVPFNQNRDDAIIAELTTLSALDYERQRGAKAKELNIRVSMLDKLVTAARPKDDTHDEPNPFVDVEAWPDTVNGSELLTEIVSNITRFCVLPEHSCVLMAAWILHAWTHDTADISPILAFVSPEKRCGKTTALSVVGTMAPRAMHNVNVTTSVLFRVVERYCPTVLIDEGDTYLTDNEELRGIINGGHNRLSAYVWRSVGDNHDPKQFKVWSPKCIAMIGKLPDTLEDRALVIPLRRKQTGEVVERFRADKLKEYLPLRRRAQRWADDNMARLRDMDASVPDALHDRAQDNARAICAIADIAGGEWPQAIRTALVGLAALADDEPRSAGVLLLSDVSQILDSWRGERIASQELCDALCNLDDGPWAEWWGGRPITTRRIATLLKPYGIRPKRDRIGSFYSIKDFTDAFNRYLSNTPDISATSATSTTQALCSPNKPHGNNTLDDVALTNPENTKVSQTATVKCNEINGRCTCGTCGSSKRVHREGIPLLRCNSI